MIRHGFTWAALVCTALLAIAPELTAAERTSASLPSYTRPVVGATATPAQQVGSYQRRPGSAYWSRPSTFPGSYGRPYSPMVGNPNGSYRVYGWRHSGYPYGSFGPYSY